MPKSLFQTAFDSYQTGRELGSGGTGFVVEATATNGDRVAIKVFNPPNRKHAADTRFRNEMIFGEKSAHKNVVAVLDRGVTELKQGPAPFYVMRLYPRTLRKLIAARPDPEVSLKIFLNMLEGVECAHLQTVWHRDLKPENILSSADGAEIVVADFGAAHFGDSAHYEAAETSHHDRLANFRYCAPEQAERGGRVDQTVDIYALGLMLNEMFTGEVMRGSSPTSIASAAPEYKYLDALVERMTRQRPAERFQSIAAVKEEFADLSKINVARQRVDKLTQSVIQDDGPNDPFLENPIRIIDSDWDNGRLILTLSSPPTNPWKQYFQVNRVSMNMRSLPQMATWPMPNVFSVPADDHAVKSIYGQYEQHIIQVNNEYANRLRSEHKQRIAEQAQRRADERRNAEKRAKALEQLRRT